jgi:TatD DNase family protein
MLVDSHCHLDDKRFAGDLDAVLERAEAAGVTRILTIGTGDGPPEIDRAVRLAERYPQVYASIGVHPHDASKVTPGTYDDLRALASHAKVVAFGEIGLDYHYDFSPREIQREVFIEQLRLARDVDLPVTIHTREAWDDTMRILREHWSGAGIMHCFTGDPAQAKEALGMGLHLSFGGVLTFKTAENVRESARITPDDRILIETDAPDLAPIPHRGKRNEPVMMIETARKLAEVRGTTVEGIAGLTTANFERLCLRPRIVTRYTDDSDGN